MAYGTWDCVWHNKAGSLFEEDDDADDFMICPACGHEIPMPLPGECPECDHDIMPF